MCQHFVCDAPLRLLVVTIGSLCKLHFHSTPIVLQCTVYTSFHMKFIYYRAGYLGQLIVRVQQFANQKQIYYAPVVHQRQPHQQARIRRLYRSISGRITQSVIHTLEILFWSNKTLSKEWNSLVIRSYCDYATFPWKGAFRSRMRLLNFSNIFFVLH